MNLIEQKLARIDLNLLVSFSVLLQEKNVSRAAEKLFISQSAMSKVLKRLRNAFDDPLFYRTSDGLIPSEKAEKLGALLPDAFQALGKIVIQEEFDPLTSTVDIAISLPSILGPSCTLPLFKTLAKEAPLMRFSEHSAKSNPFHLLESGALDFSFYLNDILPVNFTSTYIGSVDIAIIARKQHPLFAVNKLTLNDCLTYNFVGLNTDSANTVKFNNPIDKILLNIGLSRNVVFSSNQLQVLVEILKTTDNLLVAPTEVLKSKEFSQYFSSVYQFELSEEDEIKFYLIEHKRIEKSLEHQWFKQKLLDSLIGLR